MGLPQSGVRPFVPSAHILKALPVNSDEILALFKSAGALLEGHFILSSGRRSAHFLQKALVFQDPVLTEKLCAALAGRIRAELGAPDVIASPATGGIIPGYETARALGCRAIYLEREDEIFRLRRGFSIAAHETVVMVEDIITTGLSSRECLASLAGVPGRLLGAACLIDRSDGRAEIGTRLVALARIGFPDYAPDELPPELAALPAIKPGSRGMQ